MARLVIVFWCVIIGTLSAPNQAFGSDHDDGETDDKARALSLTDLFVFRKDWQTGRPEDRNQLIFIMNLNPRSLPGQQYYYSDKARYQFHITRNPSAQKTVRPTGREDIVFRFEFGHHDANAQQRMTVTSIFDGQAFTTATTTSGGPILTTSLKNSQNDKALIFNQINIKGQAVTLFAGPRQDPFFFDVVQFFKVRNHALLAKQKKAQNPADNTPLFLGFLPPSRAQDFATGYNVLSIIMDVPIALLANNNPDNTIFDVWETISIPQ